MKYITTASMAILGIALIGAAIWWEVNIWTECRDADFSWFYCMRMISK